MGADLILAIAVMPGEYTKMSLPDGAIDSWRIEYRKALFELDAPATFELLEEYTGDLSFEDEGGHIRSLEYMRLKSARQDLWDIIDETIVDISSMPRDVTYCKVGKRWALITGGMSWGDSPSDSYDAVNLISNIWYCAGRE